MVGSDLGLWVLLDFAACSSRLEEEKRSLLRCPDVCFHSQLCGSECVVGGCRIVFLRLEVQGSGFRAAFLSVTGSLQSTGIMSLLREPTVEGRPAWRHHLCRGPSFTAVAGLICPLLLVSHQNEPEIDTDLGQRVRRSIKLRQRSNSGKKKAEKKDK